ncbi:hypothetical protein JQC92_04980 [Shewanella sp. 202IG2-18]|uniref:hypothetical protein n=1 Tax=Parashewanella hymeniacidonis TaxID=2807618 RepID=UPI001961FCDF|nr:hypothetical protein [Parashewanella hymeniacidonis]MBM7071394.1 hypothetical protein [Parashewanella hymeniacidonis]
MSFSFPVFIRTLMAIFGGYAVGISASFGMIPISLWLFTDNVHDAIFIGLMCSYVFAFIAFIWCFSCKKTIHSVRVLVLAGIAFMAIYYLFPVEKMS